MARIPYPESESQSSELRDLLDRLGSLNVTRMMSHSEGLMRAYSKLGTYILRKGRLEPVVREAVILRIGQLCGSDYEWHQHSSVARAVGMPEEMISDIEEKNDTRLPEDVQAALEIAEQIKQHAGASSAAIARAGSHFNPEEIVEIIMTAGYYIMTAGLLLSLDIEIEETPPLGSSLSNSSN